MHISSEQLNELTSVIEDTVEYACDHHTLSGELAWSVVQSLATAKLTELEGAITSDAAL